MRTIDGSYGHFWELYGIFIWDLHWIYAGFLWGIIRDVWIFTEIYMKILG